MRIVSDLISIHCSNKNYCANATLSDIRPVIMIQLSRISTGNYATSCGGYIDGEFDKYIASHGGGTQQPRVYLPAHTSTSKAPQIQVKNPYTPQTPDWAIEIQERKQELQDLQSENGTNVYGITQTDFPTTYADMSFSDRMKNEQIGYEPYKNTRAYTELKVESLDTYQNRFASSNKGKTLAKLQTDAEKIIEKYDELRKTITELQPKAQGIAEAQRNLQSAGNNLNAAKTSADEVLDTLTRQVQTSELTGLTNTIADAQNKINNAKILIDNAKDLCKTPEEIKEDITDKIEETLETTIGNKDKEDSIFQHLQTFNFGSCTAQELKNYKEEAYRLQTDIVAIRSKLRNENDRDKLIELNKQIKDKKTEAEKLLREILNFVTVENPWMFENSSLKTGFNKFPDNKRNSLQDRWNYQGIDTSKDNYVIIILPCKHKKSKKDTKLELPEVGELSITGNVQDTITNLVWDNNPFAPVSNETIYYDANNYVLEETFLDGRGDIPFIFQDFDLALLMAQGIFTSYWDPQGETPTYGMTLYVVKLDQKVAEAYFDTFSQISNTATNLAQKLAEHMKGKDIQNAEDIQNTVAFGPMEMYNTTE
jgi:hypothetical protein